MRMDVQTDAIAPLASIDRLLLDEFSHRTANEIAAAIAAIRIACRMEGEAGRAALLEDAVGRLEAFAEVHRLLSARERGIIDAGDRLRSLCCALASSRRHLAGVLTLDVPDINLDALTVRCLLMVASELVTNAIRHALGANGSRLLVRLTAQRGFIVMTIADDGPGMGCGSTTSRTGLGRGIVQELVTRSRGRIDTRSGPAGTRIRVALPIAPVSASRRTAS